MLNEKPLRQTLAVNLEAPLLVTSYLYRKKILQDGATIVWLGSQSAHDAGEGFSMYAASKAGLAAAARVLNKEFARRRMHCIEPGTVDTPMTQALIEQFGGLKDGHADSMLSPEAVAKEIFAKTQNREPLCGG
jgi:3-oxoacyl-[acyl-carrier protein] reductase